MHSSFVRKAICVAITSGLLAACGGSDGDSSVNAGNNTATGVVITSTNMVDVASAAAVAAAVPSGLGGIGQSIAVGVQVSTKLDPMSVMKKVIFKEANTLFSPHNHADVAVGVTVSETVQCGTSGSASVTGTVQSQNAPTTGDNLTVSFANCIDSDFGAGVKINGAMKITLNSVSGTFSPTGNGDIAIVLTNFGMTEGQTSATMSGDLRAVVQVTGVRDDTTITSSALAIQLQNAGKSYSMKLTGYNEKTTDDNAQKRTEDSVSFHVDATTPTVSGEMDISTSTMILDYWNSTVQSGKIKIAGKGSNLFLTMQGNDMVLLELDADGNGTIDASVTKSASELDPFTL